MVLAGALGFAIIAQVRQTSIQGLENLREDELVRIFAGVDRDGDQLADEIRGLESSLELLQSRSTNDAEAQRAAQQRLDSLGILAGTAPATGPGIVMTISDPERAVDAPGRVLEPRRRDPGRFGSGAHQTSSTSSAIDGIASTEARWYAARSSSSVT